MVNAQDAFFDRHCWCRDYLIEKLEVGKWIFLWVVLAEGASLVLAMVMRCMGELKGRCACHSGCSETSFCSAK